MTPGIGDHLLIAMIAIAYPIYCALRWYRHDRPQLESGKVNARPHVYRETTIVEWLMTVVVLTHWFWIGRTAAGIGLGVPRGWALWIGLLVVIAAAVILLRQVATVRGSYEARRQIRKQISAGTAQTLFTPRTSYDRRWWVGLSLTAGICEEVLHRGFLLWYLMLWLPGAAAVPIAAVLFGLAHSYLGWGGALRATALGLVFCVAYLLSGSIWLLIALHAVVDISSGFISSAALEEEAAEAD